MTKTRVVFHFPSHFLFYFCLVRFPKDDIAMNERATKGPSHFISYYLTFSLAFCVFLSLAPPGINRRESEQNFYFLYAHNRLYTHAERESFLFHGSLMMLDFELPFQFDYKLQGYAYMRDTGT